MLTTISTSFEPSRSVLMVETMPCLSVSVLAKLASWNGSIFVVRPKFNSGVSRKVLTCAPSIFSKVPTSYSNGSHDKKPIAPDSSARRPRTTSMLPLPSLRWIWSAREDIRRPTTHTYPSLGSVAISTGSPGATTGREPSRRTAMREDWLMFRDIRP